MEIDATIPPTPTPSAQSPTAAPATRAAARAQAPGTGPHAAAGETAPAGPRQLDVSLGIDGASKRTVVTVRNARTGELVGQLPAKQILEIAATIRDNLASKIDELA